MRLPEPLYVYCRSGASLTARPSARLAGWEELRRMWGDAALREAGRSPELERCLSASC